LQLWLTPHGFLKGAAGASDAAITPGKGSNEISFTALGKYKITGAVDSQNLVTRVATTVSDPVLGDTPLTANYSDYKDYNGVKFPARINVEQGGAMIWDLTIDSVQPGAAVNLPVPEAAQTATVPPVMTQSTRLAPGVWHVTGGSHHSLVVEFADYLAVIEGPQSDERAAAVIAEAKKLVPNKPINYVISTHHHFDHSGGLRTFVAEGATVVTHESNRGYFEKAFTNPATVAPDTLAKNPKPPKFETVSDKHVITDGKQTIEVYQIPGDNHTTELLVAYLPGPRILVEADAYSPNDPNARPQPAPPNAVNVYDKVTGLKLNVATIAPIHGRGAVPFAEFRRFVGK
jgi:glyoxylase-like metal-dependent hydrolase (beta-lactamase superfamily II)